MYIRAIIDAVARDVPGEKQIPIKKINTQHNLFVVILKKVILTHLPALLLLILYINVSILNLRVRISTKL